MFFYLLVLYRYILIYIVTKINKKYIFLLYAYSILGEVLHFINYFSKKFSYWLIALRAYSLPISIMAWIVPFTYSLSKGGNLKYGFIALIGIIILHLGSNLFDDTIDYLIAKERIKKGLTDCFNFQEGKCFCIFKNLLSIKDYIVACIILFLSAGIIGLYFLNIYGLKLLYILIPTLLLCLFYPILGSLGLGEVIIAIIFAPLLYIGTYYVMSADFSATILILSISTGLLTVAVLHTHMLLDYKIDTKNKKITLCRICKSEKKAYYLLCVFVIGAYFNIIILCNLGYLSSVYYLTFLSLPTAYTLLKVMKIHIKNHKEEIKQTIFMGDIRELNKAEESQKNFLLKFLIVRNLLSIFTILLCISIILSRIMK